MFCIYFIIDKENTYWIILVLSTALSIINCMLTLFLKYCSDGEKCWNKFCSLLLTLVSLISFVMSVVAFPFEINSRTDQTMKARINSEYSMEWRGMVAKMAITILMLYFDYQLHKMSNEMNTRYNRRMRETP